MRLIVVCLLMSKKIHGGELPMVRAASALPQKRRKKAVGKNPLKSPW